MAPLIVVLPVCNESSRIETTLRAVRDFVREREGFHFVFVDDGSVDGTAEIIRRSLNENPEPKMELVACPVNGGKGAAVKAGFYAACRGNDFAFTDGDLAYSLDHLEKIREALRTHDVVIGSRGLVTGWQRSSSLRRQVLGWGFNRLARMVAGLPYRDTQAGLKGFRAQAAERIFSRLRITDFGFDVELLYLAHKLGFRVKEIPARVEESHSYKIAKIKLLRDSLKMFMDLVRIRYNDTRGLYE